MNAMLKRFTGVLLKRPTSTLTDGDIEEGEAVGGAGLNEMDCRWSPAMALKPPPEFEETLPFGKAVGTRW